MAGLLNRLSRVFGSSGDQKTAASGDAATAPADSLAAQADLLQQVRRSAAQVAAGRKQLGAQITRMVTEIDSLGATARRSVQAGRDELAREALARRHDLSARLRVLEAEHDQLQREEEQLVLTSTRLHAKLDAIRARQARDLASLSAAEAHDRLNAALAQLSGEVGRAGAVVDEIAQRGEPGTHDQVPDDPTASANDIAAELDAMKAELAAEAGQQATSYLQPGQQPSAGPIQDAMTEQGER